MQNHPALVPAGSLICGAALLAQCSRCGKLELYPALSTDTVLPAAEHPIPCRTTLPHWACAHVAAFAGAVLGGVGTWAYAVKGKLHHHPRGVHDWTVGAPDAASCALGKILMVDAPSRGVSALSGNCDRAVHGLYMLLACFCLCMAASLSNAVCCMCKG